MKPKSSAPATTHTEAIVRETSHQYQISGRGVVGHYIHSTTDQNTSNGYTSAQLINTLKLGLPVQELDDLRKGLDLPMDRLAPILGISKATLHRRKSTGRLDQAESDRVLRFARLLGKTVEVMETVENARRWLISPQVGLGGAVPLEYAETEIGAREVEDLLGRIEYGVYA